MRYNFVKFGITANLELDEQRRDYPFFEQNRDVFTQIFDFLSGPKSCFIMTGMQGVGKSKILSEAVNYLNNDVLLFRYRMYEATTLDDILLNLTVDFREYQKNLQISLPKINSKDFREKIEFCIKNINKPMLLILEAYENVFKCEETSKIINDFLLHISSIDKFKIIFVSRNFETQILENKEIAYDRAIITSLDENLVEKYFKNLELATTEESLSKLISNSRCYLKYIDMTIKLIQTFNLSLDELMSEFELKNTNYYNFLINKFLSLIPEKSRELIYILTLIRQGISTEFLSLIKKNIPSEINYLKNILILNEDTKNNLYVKDYFKRELEKEIEQYETIKIHDFLEKFYENMLPKKPLERELLISRNTMRREKEYHSKFVDSYQLSKMRSEHSASKNLSKIHEEKLEKEKQVEKETQIEQNIIPNTPLRRKTTRSKTTKNLSDCILVAQKYEKNFDFNSAIYYYQKAIEFKNDENYINEKANILTQIANCYVKIDEHEKAIKYFIYAYEQYLNQNKKTKANEILFDLAIEHKNNYKLYLAKNCLEKIIKSEETQPELLSKSYSLLADIEDLAGNINLAKDLYKKSLDNALNTTNKELLSSAYFKYGLLLDDTNQQTQAIECYKKCIEISSDAKVNSSLSSAYSNLAGISYERGSTATALNYYQKALEADKITQNNEGLYFVYTKLSSLYEKEDKQTSYKFLLNALQSAKKLKDKLCISSAYLEIGDYYYRQSSNEQAIKAYLSAKHFIDNEIDVENKMKIDTRLKDIKIKIGDTKYNKILEDFNYNDEN